MIIVRYLHSEISGFRVNSSRHLFSNMLSPTLETNDIGKHTVELPNLFLNPRSSDAGFDNFTCKWVTCQVVVSNSIPLMFPRSKPPAQITYFPESLSKLTTMNHQSSTTKIRNIILTLVTGWVPKHFKWFNFFLNITLFYVSSRKPRLQHNGKSQRCTKKPPPSSI